MASKNSKCPGCRAKDGFTPHLRNCGVPRGGVPEHLQKAPPKFQYRKGEKCNLFCPLCSFPLLYANDKKWLELGAESLMCPKGCFGDDYPLIHHHPIHGMDKEPGDSWSLTWLK